MRLQPGASRAAIEGLSELADGRIVLKVRVGEPPEGGKANAALIKLLAKTWKLPKTRLRVVAGHNQRLKILLIEGDAPELRSQIGPQLSK